VLSHRLWSSRFAQDPAVLGCQVKFDRTQYAVIGVMPAGFEYREAQYWIPLMQTLNPGLATRRNVWMLDPIARLRPGVSAAVATREVQAISAQVNRDFPESRRGLIARATPLRVELSRDLRPALLILLGAVAVVLLIVCGNIAALMLVRGNSRIREMAIRRTLGVSHLRLLRQLLTESAVLACTGGALGIALGFLATRSLVLLTRDPRLLHVPLDASVLAFAISVTVATTILFGVVPAVRGARVAAAEALRSGPRTGATLERARSQQTLVVLEIALCLVLLAGAGLLLKSFRRVLDVDPGFRSDRLVTTHVVLSPAYDSSASILGFYRRLDDRLSHLPGVSAATIVSGLPISGGDGTGDLALEDRPSPEGQLGATIFRGIMPNYFQVMGIPLRAGRSFSEHDRLADTHPVIINERFARHFWPDSDPIGKRFKAGIRDRAPWFTIVGVAGDVRYTGLESDAPFCTYTLLTSSPDSGFNIALRTAGETNGVMGALGRELRTLDPAALVDKPQTMSERIDESVSPRRLNLRLFELFAGLALLLAAVGLYGVVAYAASQRSREFGIRMALGAQARDVLGLVLGQGIKLVLVGTALGLFAALYLSRWIAGLLFAVQPNDWPTLLAVTALLTAVALLACWLPAYRATRITPLETLRIE